MTIFRPPHGTRNSTEQENPDRLKSGFVFVGLAPSTPAPKPPRGPQAYQRTSFPIFINARKSAKRKKSDKYSEFVVFERKSYEFCPNIARFPRRGRELTGNSVEI